MQSPVQSFPPVDLLCEEALEPLGIDTSQVIFRWKNPGYNTRQTHYRLIIEQEDGHIQYDTSIQAQQRPLVHCDLSAFLTSYTRYYWKVAVRMEHAVWSDFSEPACFETADLERKLFPAQWITAETVASYAASSWESGTPGEMTPQEKALHYYGIYLGTSFSLEADPKDIIRARCYVTGVGLYTLSLNGNTVGDTLLSPDMSKYQARVGYDTHDITGLLKSRNELLLTLGNGRHIALYGYQKPRAICLVQIFYKQQRRQCVVSDETWRSGSGPVQENSLFDGENYDARIPIHLETSAICIPGYPLQSRSTPPITLDKTLAPVSIRKTFEGYSVDFCQNISGYVELCGAQPAGTTVTIAHAELLTKNGKLNRASLRAAKAQDSYTFRGCPSEDSLEFCKGSVSEVWHPHFTYHGFRYIAVTGWVGEFSEQSVTAHFIHTKTEPAGSFSCSHEDLNAVHSAILWGQQSNMMGIPTDSPQRDERHGWLGDALLACEQALLNFAPYQFYQKFLQDIADTQREDGAISDVAPNFWMEKPADPAWGSAYITIGYLLYVYSGSTASLTKHYPSYERYLAFLFSCTEQGILQELGTFGDWCAPGLVTSKKTGLPCISTWYFLHDITLMERISGILGYNDRETYYGALKREITNSFLEHFYNGSVIVSQKLSPWDFPDTTSQLLALSLKLLPPKKHSELAAQLDRLVTIANGNHVGTGIHGTAYLLPILSAEGYEQKAFTIATQESYPGWIYMLRNGATTLWERWELIECEGMNSHNHIMLGSIDSWFYHYIAGIAPLAPLWEYIGFYPGYFPELYWAQAEVCTPYGKSSISWTLEDDKLQVHIELPAGTLGILHLPCWACTESLEHRFTRLEESEIPNSGHRVHSAEHAYLLPPGLYTIVSDTRYVLPGKNTYIPGK